jgi:PIN domain nuclease of toxin-antitoxin system
LIFWQTKVSVSEDFITFFDRQEYQGALYVSSVSFWETAFLVKKGKVAMPNVHAWKNDLLSNTNIRLIDPTAPEMIDSVFLPDHHKDPFDRLLITQANQRGMTLVTQDQDIQKYDVQHFWI